MNEKITAVVPTMGRVETLPMVFTALAFQTYPIHQMIVLDEAKSPIAESWAVNQALDVLSLQGVEVILIRNRRRSGIGPARRMLVEKSDCPWVLMVDDDVVLRPTCLAELMKEKKSDRGWLVPTCFLVPAALELEGYLDMPVDPEDPRVTLWTSKYPWFVPYFKYTSDVCCELDASGTQCILLDRQVFLRHCQSVSALGNLPREDTYITKSMPGGWFVSRAECLHYEHASQADRGNWDRTSFYRLHEAILRDPEGFVEFMKDPERKVKVEESMFSRNGESQR